MQEFRDGIRVVAVDLGAPLARALRDVLPHAALVVDRWHLHRLANLMLTLVRQRVTQTVHGQRGRSGNDAWSYRRLLLSGDAPSPTSSGWLKKIMGSVEEDADGEITAAWAAKEALRQLLDELPAVHGPLVVDRRRIGEKGLQPASAPLRPYALRPRLHRFYALAAAAGIPELTRFATTIETWWPAVEAFPRLRVTRTLPTPLRGAASLPARTEGYDRRSSRSSGPPAGCATSTTTSCGYCRTTRRPLRDQPQAGVHHAEPRRATSRMGHGARLQELREMSASALAALRSDLTHAPNTTAPRALTSHDVVEPSKDGVSELPLSKRRPQGHPLLHRDGYVKARGRGRELPTEDADGDAAFP